MKTKIFLIQFLLIAMMSLGSLFAQDDEGTYVDNADADSVETSDILDFDAEFDEEEKSSNGLVIGIVVGVAVIAGVAVFLLKKKK